MVEEDSLAGPAVLMIRGMNDLLPTSNSQLPSLGLGAGRWGLGSHVPRLGKLTTGRPSLLEIDVFETFAVLSTLGCIAVFVVMFRMDRASRNDDESAGSGSR